MGKRESRTSLVTKEAARSSRRWFLLDVEGKTLGRVAGEVARILRGKHKVTFTPHIDCGDGVVIVNASKIRVTGKKEGQKVYRHYTGFMGGMREIPYRVMQARKPAFILWHAVKGMMPKTKLARAQMKRLRIEGGGQHQLCAQQPVALEI